MRGWALRKVVRNLAHVHNNRAPADVETVSVSAVCEREITMSL